MYLVFKYKKVFIAQLCQQVRSHKRAERYRECFCVNGRYQMQNKGTLTIN